MTQRRRATLGQRIMTTRIDANQAPDILLEGVSYTYPGKSISAIEDVSLRVDHGERLGILGPNGGGKSTLLRIALGLLRGYRGRVEVCGVSPTRARRSGLIGYVPQRCEANLTFPITARQAVAMGAAREASPWRRYAPGLRNRIEQALALTGAEEWADEPVGQLSGGQLQRVLIARALAPAPRILALDEPTVGIDVEGQRRFAELLSRLGETLDLTLLVVSHDIRAMAAGCDRVACLARTVHFHDAPEGLTPQVLAEVFSHDVEGAFGDVHVHAHPAEDCPFDHDHGDEHGDRDGRGLS